MHPIVAHPLSEHNRKRAYGPQRVTTPFRRAQFIAESVLLHRDEGRPRCLADYGIAPESPMAAEINAWLQRLGSGPLTSEAS